MPGFNIFFFSQQNLAKSGIISATINCSSSLYANPTTNAIIQASIFGTSQIAEALLYNYLANKLIVHPMHLKSDDIPIGHLVCPKPIEETIPPTPIEPEPPPVFPTFIQPPDLAIMKSYSHLSAITIRPQVIKEIEYLPTIIPPTPPPLDPAIAKTYIQLTDPLKPRPITHSKTRL